MAQEILSHAANYNPVVIDGPPRAQALSRRGLATKNERGRGRVQ